MSNNTFMQGFHDWRASVRNLLRRRDLKPSDVAFGEWRFDWFAAFVAGCRPYEAIEDAIAELRGRGLLDEDGNPTEEYRNAIESL